MSIFNDKALRGVAEAVSKIVDEELKGNQHKIDANKNGKIDAHDFKLLRAKKTIKEDDVGYQHRYSVKNGKATVHNPAKGEKDEPHHVYADSEEHAVRKHAAQNKPTVKEEVKKNEYHIAGKHKFPTKDEHAVTVKHTESGREHVHSGKGKYLSKLIKSRYDINHHFESVELDEAFPTVDDAKKRMAAGKTATGSVTKTKTGLVHKRDYEDESDSEDTQKASKKTGARQNNFNRGKSTGYISKPKAVKEETKLSFTEMLQLYNEAGLEVIAKIVPEKVEFGDIEVEVFDADKINGTIETTVVEEVDNETFTKEVEAQKEKNAGRGKKAEVAKASVQAVKQEEYEQIDEAAKWRKTSVAKIHPAHDPEDYMSSSSYDYYHDNPRSTGNLKATSDTETKRHSLERRPHVQVASKGERKGMITKQHGERLKDRIKSSLSSMKKEEVEQIDELKKSTVASYIQKKFGKMSDEPVSKNQYGYAKKDAKGIQRAGLRMSGIKATQKEEVQMDERTLTPTETKEKEKNVKGMKKSLSGFKSRYGDDAKSVMYATATKMAKKD